MMHKFSWNEFCNSDNRCQVCKNYPCKCKPVDKSEIIVKTKGVSGIKEPIINKCNCGDNDLCVECGTFCDNLICNSCGNHNICGKCGSHNAPSCDKHKKSSCKDINIVTSCSVCDKPIDSRCDCYVRCGCRRLVLCGDQCQCSKFPTCSSYKCNHGDHCNCTRSGSRSHCCHC